MQGCLGLEKIAAGRSFHKKLLSHPMASANNPALTFFFFYIYIYIYKKAALN
jgi:hypothetical protein